MLGLHPTCYLRTSASTIPCRRTSHEKVDRCSEWSGEAQCLQRERNRTALDEPASDAMHQSREGAGVKLSSNASNVVVDICSMYDTAGKS